MRRRRVRHAEDYGDHDSQHDLKIDAITGRENAYQHKKGLAGNYQPHRNPEQRDRQSRDGRVQGQTM
ncbi:hypothetical protein [Nocardia barduliensis]|uniref:hypothetical protein n=1 Tax=Nocardia barduliensis TaxID=2736643 RepID=UPI0015721043|nr:hypothetical protein [Nocardia barduliensis]